MAVTIKDIAERLQISVSTVSYALNGGPRNVPAEVRERVLAMARELNYRPNRIARSMITGRCQTIGVVPPEVTADVFLSPYLHAVLNAIANEAGNLSQDILIYTRYHETERDDMVSILLDGRVDGVIFIAPHYSHKSIEVAAGLHIPTVAISGTPVEGVASFTVDNVGGMRMAMQHLYDLGHRQIAHIAGRTDMPDAILRMEAYRAFLLEKGLPAREEWIRFGDFTIEGGQSSLRALMDLDSRPTAITCGNDEMAIGALHECLRMGIRVPEEISIIGFDMSPASSQAVLPLSTIRQPIAEMSVAAVQALIGFIENKARPETTILRTELIARATTAAPGE